MDFYQGKILFFYLIAKPMVSTLDMLGPRMVGGLLRKVDGTLVIVVELEFVLPNSQLSNKLLHPDYLLVGFNSSHVLHFCGQ